MFRIIVNNDPNIKQSYFLVPDNDPYFNQSYLVSPNHMNMNMNMMLSKKHRKSSKKHRKSKHHGNYENHGQYGQFGVPLLSPEFLSPEFPMPLPIPGYISGHINHQHVIDTINTAATAAVASGTTAAVVTAVDSTGKIVESIHKGDPHVTHIVSKATSAATTEANRMTPLPLPTAATVAQAVKTALSGLHAPGPLGPFGMAGTVSSFPFTSPIMSPVPIPITYPRVNNIRHLTNPDDDPELRRKVVKHFYKQLKEIYFIDKLKKLFQYIIIENNSNTGNNNNTGNNGNNSNTGNNNNTSVRLVKTYEEYKKNENNNNDSNIKIKFITENIFSKYDLEVLISKLIAKYGMLNSDDENNMHWYTAKYKYASLVKKAMYKKIKYRFEKKVKF